jgi:hypothetical protein
MWKVNSYSNNGGKVAWAQQYTCATKALAVAKVRSILSGRHKPIVKVGRTYTVEIPA